MSYWAAAHAIPANTPPQLPGVVNFTARRAAGAFPGSKCSVVLGGMYLLPETMDKEQCR